MGQDSPMYYFLKARRPDEFSDSTIKKQGKLTREFLDYYLNSLTSRSQEKEFEIWLNVRVTLAWMMNNLFQSQKDGQRFQNVVDLF